MKLRKPCDNCPWRVDAPRKHWAPDHFTAIWDNCQDDGMHVMLCHKANNLPGGAKHPDAPPCQGWLRVIGFNAIGIRLLVMCGRATLEEVEDRSPPELFESFEAMLKANKIRLPKRNKWTQ